MPPWPVRLLACYSEVMNADGMAAYRSVSIKVLFACEHLWFARQGMICSYSTRQETLAELLLAL